MKMGPWSGPGVLLLALFHLPIPTSAQDGAATPQPSFLFSNQPGNLSVAAGDSAVIRCRASPAPSRLTLTLYGNRGNRSLICPGEQPVEDIPEALRGGCEQNAGELAVVWTITGTSYHDNGTRFVCKQGDQELTVFLRVYDDGTHLAVMLGCVLGGFFGMVLVFALSCVTLWRSETLRRCCFGDGQTDDDMETIVTKD